MTTNTQYQSLVNIDDASTFDNIRWHVEERGLSLPLLDAEANLERVEEYKSEVEDRLEDLEKKGYKARAAVLRRIDLEQKATVWTYLPDWYMDSWFEENTEVQLGDYHHIKRQYREAKQFLAEICKREEALVAAEAALTPETEEANPQEVLGDYNNLHWEGVKRSGRKLLFTIRKLKALGEMDDTRINRAKAYVWKLAEKRQLTRLSYCECMSILTRWQGRLEVSLNLKAEAKEIEATQDKKASTFKSMPYQPSMYNVDMANGLDIKREALELASMNLSIPEAITMVMEGADY